MWALTSQHSTNTGIHQPPHNPSLSNWVLPTEGKHGWAQDAVATVQRLVCVIAPDAQVTVVGSVACKLCLPDSDLDIVVTQGAHQNELMSRDWSKVFLSDLLYRLIHHAGVSRASTSLVEAKVPILIFNYGGGRVDVSFNQVHAIGHVFFFQSVLERFPWLRNILLLVKRWLRARKLPTSKQGGVPVIAWMLLAVYACYETGDARSFFELLAKGCDMEIVFESSFPKSLPTIRLGVPFAVYDPCAYSEKPHNLVAGVSEATLLLYQMECKRILKGFSLGGHSDILHSSYWELLKNPAKKDIVDVRDISHDWSLYLVDGKNVLGSTLSHAASPLFVRKDDQTFYMIKAAILVGRVIMPIDETRQVHPSDYVTCLECDGFLVSEDSMWLLEAVGFMKNNDDRIVLKPAQGATDNNTVGAVVKPTEGATENSEHPGAETTTENATSNQENQAVQKTTQGATDNHENCVVAKPAQSASDSEDTDNCGVMKSTTGSDEAEKNEALFHGEDHLIHVALSKSAVPGWPVICR
eukprot:GEMP01008417.1.p1 GENE.GEMP01008417.1~~GEMP01008417.1.p1  ORF type:complete len:525 (+),score=78.85 GEMP01008417.1:227-1801(+)